MVPIPTGGNRPVVDIGALAQPITKLIEVVAQGIGTVYRPADTVLQAIADAKAKVILAEGDIQQTELWQRAAHRLVHTEVGRQRNLDAIVEKAHAALPDKVADTPVSRDWTTHFFTAAQDVSDEDMQKLWGRVLAGEVASPGGTSRRTLEFLKTMGKVEAVLFTKFLSVCFGDLNGWAFVVEDAETSNVLTELVADVDVMRHLIDIGILSPESSLVEAPNVAGREFYYGRDKYKFFGPPRRGTGLGPLRMPEPLLGYRQFTSIGYELSKVAEQTPLPDFIARLSRSLDSQFHVRIEKF
jgi:Protein of unknown function (DUF2806)